MTLSPEQQLELIRANTIDLIPEEELLAKLRSGRPLRVKLGVDPTGPDIHLGHAVVLRKLRFFQDLGHTAVLIIGDFTGLIGDPSGRNEGRPQLTREQVEKNVSTYREQVFKILDPEKTEFHYNSEWLSKLTPEEIIRLAATHTVNQLLAREDFRARYTDNQPISLHEFLYPLLQGYDSVAIRSDIELGGTEQKFNMLVGRELQRMAVFGEPQEPQAIITFPILVGTDGVRRMGKSLGNYIGVTDPPDGMFGKIMSIPDECIEQYFVLCTDVPPTEIAQMVSDMKSGALNPRDAKRRLGREIVTLYHSAEAGQAADETFLRVFSSQRQQTREDYEAVAEEVAIPAEYRGATWGPIWISTALVWLGLAKSKGEAARLVRGGGVYVDEQRIADPQQEITLVPGTLLRVGKRRVVRLVSGSARGRER
jgi:tyrosyl-tRNA synthetase